MNEIKFHITVILIFAVGIGCGTFLVVSGHPWFALLVFGLTACVQITDHEADRHGELAYQDTRHFSILRWIFKKRELPLIESIGVMQDDGQTEQGGRIAGNTFRVDGYKGQVTQ